MADVFPDLEMVDLEPRFEFGISEIDKEAIIKQLVCSALYCLIAGILSKMESTIKKVTPLMDLAELRLKQLENLKTSFSFTVVVPGFGPIDFSQLKIPCFKNISPEVLDFMRSVGIPTPASNEKASAALKASSLDSQNGRVRLGSKTSPAAGLGKLQVASRAILQTDKFDEAINKATETLSNLQLLGCDVPMTWLSNRLAQLAGALPRDLAGELNLTTDDSLNDILKKFTAGVLDP